jgi:anti-sigma regulatory factor (Ser/Thr protein kinase)
MSGAINVNVTPSVSGSTHTFQAGQTGHTGQTSHTGQTASGALPGERMVSALPNSDSGAPALVPGHTAAAESLAVLRHEVGNALTPAAAYTEQLLRRLPSWAGERERFALEAIRGSLRRARALLVLPDHEGPEEAPPWCDLRDALAAALSQVPPERLADVSIRDTAADRLGGYWHARPVIQALANVLENALKYSPRGAPVRIELTATDEHARVVIRDRGIGMTGAEVAAALEGIRSAAAQVFAPGTGLGLRLTKQLIAAAGGDLTITSIPGHGTVVAVRLPRANNPLLGIQAAGASNTHRRSAARCHTTARKTPVQARSWCSRSKRERGRGSSGLKESK